MFSCLLYYVKMTRRSILKIIVCMDDCKLLQKSNVQMAAMQVAICPDAHFTHAI